MSEVTFTLPADLPPELAAQVPVDILDHELIKTATGRAGATFNLQAGLYAARAILPSGLELGVAFLVPDQVEPLEIKLSYVAGTTPLHGESPTADGDAPSNPRDDGTQRHRAWPFGPGPGAGPQVRLVIGNPFIGPPETGPWRPLAPTEPFSVVGRNTVQAVEVRAAEPAHERHVMVAVQPDEERRIMFSPGVDGVLVPHMAFDDPELELLVRYLGAGMLSSAADMARSDDGLARRALREDRRPMGATLGAYVLLQTAGPRAVEEFVDDMPRRFRWLPDALVLRAEVASRQGRHDDALTDLMALRNVGPPIFSSGLSYALNRMRQYALRSLKHRLPVDVLHFAPFAAQLDWLAARTDFDRPILTYRPPAAANLSALTSNAIHSTLRSASGLFHGFRPRPAASD